MNGYKDDRYEGLMSGNKEKIIFLTRRQLGLRDSQGLTIKEVEALTLKMPVYELEPQFFVPYPNSKSERRKRNSKKPF